MLVVILTSPLLERRSMPVPHANCGWEPDLDHVAAVQRHGGTVAEDREHVAILRKHLGEEAEDLTILTGLG